MATETQETTMVTEREDERALVEARREGWCAAAYDLCDDGDITVKLRDAMIAHAPNRWPLPKVTRPRVVRIGAYEFRACGERIEERFANEGANWREASAFPLTAHNVNTWAHLLANPTEEMDDA